MTELFKNTVLYKDSYICLISLTQGAITIIDTDDLAIIQGRTWYADKNAHNIYASSNPKGEPRIRMHRMIMNPPANLMVDHINGSTLDNRRRNLRLCTALGNSRNQPRRKNSKSPYKGVNCHKNGRFYASIAPKSGAEYLGAFSTIEEAALAYDKRAIELYGEFARLNFPINIDQS